MMRFSCSSGVLFTQGHTKEAVGISEAAFGLESAASMGALELRRTGKVLSCSLEECFHRYASLRYHKLKISSSLLSFFFFRKDSSCGLRTK